MPAKPVFTDEQYEILHLAARRVWKSKFQAEGKTQTAMAHALGITQQSISNLLKGSYRPGLKVATDLAILDGKELEDLIGDFTAPTPRDDDASDDGKKPDDDLDACIRFYRSQKTWSPWTIAAARAGYFGRTDFNAPEWAAKLDQLEKALERARKAK